MDRHDIASRALPRSAEVWARLTGLVDPRPRTFFPVRPPSPRAEALAAAFLTSDAWTRPALTLHGAAAFDVRRDAAWLTKAVKLALERFASPPRARFRGLARALDEVLVEHGHLPLPPIRAFPVPALAMGEARWPVPPLGTTGDLAAWLGLTTDETTWFADPRGLERRPHADEALRHYRYAWVPKASGGLRLLEAPKPRMKHIARRILHGVLDHVPPHEAAHGFRAGRSAKTHAERHVGAEIVVRVDLADFFLTIDAARVRAIFVAMGYPSEVAFLLGSLTTNIAPVVPNAPPAGASHGAVASLRRAEMLARTRHLPQGAPTSPALANLAAYGLDVRLSAAANAASARYTRYADDLVFSGDAAFARSATRFVRLATRIVRDEGFFVNRAKTRYMRRGARQTVTGVVVNERPTLARDEAEHLEAILYNCVRSGPDSQNREDVPDFRAHLRGRVAHAASLDAKRAAPLLELFARITWE